MSMASCTLRRTRLCMRGLRLPLAALAIAFAGACGAQGFPLKPIRFIVTSPAGGANDIQARTLGARLSELFGQPVLIDNRAGASGMIAAEMVAKSPPDGYTLLLGTDATLAVNPHLFPKVPYDVQRDFAPISVNVGINYVLLVNPGVPAKSVAELVALARANPGKLNYASSGNGSGVQLARHRRLRLGCAVA